MKIKKQQNIGDVINAIVDYDRSNYDLERVEADTMIMNEDTGNIKIMGDDRRYQLSDWATRQICRWYKIPYDFWDGVLDNNKRSYLFNMFSNENNDKNFFLRCRKNENSPDIIRGVLSEKFQPLDNRYIIERINEFFVGKEQYKIVGYYMDDVSMHLRCVDENQCVDLKNNKEEDYIYSGIHLSNSEVGFKSTGIDAVVYRSVCENGAIMSYDGESFLKIDHRSNPETDFNLACEDAIWRAVEHSRKAMGLLQKSREILVNKDHQDVLKEKMGKIKMAPKSFVDSVFDMFSEKKESTLFGLVDVVTNMSQNLDWNKRISYEKYAGQLLDKLAV